MTSTAILLLVHEGKFSLEDSIIELLPDLPDSWLEVTPRHLLTHTSGVHSYTSLGREWEREGRPDRGGLASDDP